MKDEKGRVEKLLDRFISSLIIFPEEIKLFRTRIIIELIWRNFVSQLSTLLRLEILALLSNYLAPDSPIAATVQDAPILFQVGRVTTATDWRCSCNFSSRYERLRVSEQWNPIDGWGNGFSRWPDSDLSRADRLVWLFLGFPYSYPPIRALQLASVSDIRDWDGDMEERRDANPIGRRCNGIIGRTAATLPEARQSALTGRWVCSR